MMDYKIKYDDSFHHGFIAQDINQIIEQNNYNFAGYYNKSEQLYLSLIELIGPMIKAIQELSSKLDNIIMNS